jgi:site-specific recombinase XerC
MITQADIRAFLDHCKLKPKGEDNEKRNLSVLFGWAVQHHYIAANPCKGIASESGDEEKNPPRVLTIPQVVQILTLAQKEVVQPLLVAKNEIAGYHCPSMGLNSISYDRAICRLPAGRDPAARVARD